MGNRGVVAPFLFVAAAAITAACAGPQAGGSVPAASAPFARHPAAVSGARHLFYSRTYLAAHPDVVARMRGTASASGGNLIYGGGPVETQPKIYLIFWGISSANDTTDDPYGVATYLTNFYAAVGGSSWIDTVTQYYGLPPSGGAQGYVGNLTPEYEGAYYDPSMPPNPYGQLDVANEALKEVATIGYDANADYVVVTGHGVGESGFYQQFCGYHSATTYNGGLLSYTSLPYLPDAGYSCGSGAVTPTTAPSVPNLDGESIVGGHEAAETQTDPDAQTGWLDSQGNEIADKCIWLTSPAPGAMQNTTFPNGSTFPTQSLWSNASASCVQSYGSAPGTGIVNGGFETGKLSPWKTCRTAGVTQAAEIATVHPLRGKYDAYAGTYTNEREPNGFVAVCQTVTVPASGELKLFTWSISSDTSSKVGQLGAVYSTKGSALATLYSFNDNSRGWKVHTYDLSAYAGQTVRLAFGVRGVKAHTGKYVGEYVDNVSLAPAAGAPRGERPVPGAAAGVPARIDVERAAGE